MAQPTPLDWKHAYAYAHYIERKTRFEMLCTKMPHVFMHATWTEFGDPTVPANRLPATAQFVPRQYRIEFNEKGCQQIGCFNFLTGGSTCDKKGARWMRSGDETDILACQPACFNLNVYSKTKPLAPDVEWMEGKCRYAYTYSKRYASDPSCRSDKPTVGVTNLPKGFEYYSNGDIKLNKSYCDYFGADYSSRGPSCVVPWWQEHVLENIFGTTIYRMLKRSANGQSLFVFDSDKAEVRWNDSREVPANLRSVENWRAEVPRQSASAFKDYFENWKRSWRDRGTSVERYFEKIKWKELGHDIVSWESIKSVLISIGVDMAPKLAKKLVARLFGKLMSTAAGKSALQAMKAAGSKIVGKIASFAVTKFLMRTVVSASVKFIGKLIALGSSVVGWVLILFSIVQFLLDLWDPYNLKYQSDQTVLDKTAEYLKEYTYQDLADSGEPGFTTREISGDMVMAIVCYEMPEDDPVNVACSEAETMAVTQFITSLKYNSVGQILDMGAGTEVEASDPIVADPTDYIVTGVEDAEYYDFAYVPEGPVDADEAWWQYLLPFTTVTGACFLGLCMYVNQLAIATWIVVAFYVSMSYISAARYNCMRAVHELIKKTFFFKQSFLYFSF
uniref:p74 n=1 Tax=Parasteatoda tepidariorum TaxID=114398 RepID=A0A2L2Y083_PARTP